DGRFRIKDLGHTVDFRVSSLPTSYGEKIVMRILDTKAGLIDLEQLGIEGRDQELLKRIIQEPHGIILVTGPTGSGKSTTLYSVLRMLNKEGVNIITLEDPVEYVLEGINQSQVKPEIEYTFASPATGGAKHGGGPRHPEHAQVLCGGPQRVA
ncbi:MAG: ATPase, T2SS/T4P/T4SS family, partial [Bacteroidales bacterium]